MIGLRAPSLALQQSDRLAQKLHQPFLVHCHVERKNLGPDQTLLGLSASQLFGLHHHQVPSKADAKLRMILGAASFEQYLLCS